METELWQSAKILNKSDRMPFFGTEDQSSARSRQKTNFTKQVRCGQMKS